MKAEKRMVSEKNNDKIKQNRKGRISSFTALYYHRRRHLNNFPLICCRRLIDVLLIVDMAVLSNNRWAFLGK